MDSNQKEAAAVLLAVLFMEGKLNDDFLPREEFQIVQNKPLKEWPLSLREKLAPWVGSQAEPQE